MAKLFEKHDIEYKTYNINTHYIDTETKTFSFIDAEFVSIANCIFWMLLMGVAGLTGLCLALKLCRVEYLGIWAIVPILLWPIYCLIRC